MQATVAFIEARDAIEAASASVENMFFDVGKTLVSAVEIIDRLARSFETLLNELRNERLAQALATLARSADRVADLGRVRTSGSSGIDRLRAVADAISLRIETMHRSIAAVDPLAVNSSIAATSIRTSSSEFANFSSEITRTLDLTRSSLDQFQRELRPLRARVAEAHAEQVTFEQRQSAAALSVPPKLLATVASLRQQNRQAARAGSMVRRRSQRVGRQISNAIVALQIGDSTRQRLEHCGFALAMLAPEDVAAGSAMAAEDKAMLAAATCRLQAAQILNTVQRFSRDVGQIAASLTRLAAEARMMHALGNSAYGSSGASGGTFIADLEGHVGEALSLLESFGAAEAEADRVIGSVYDATASLSAHLRTVQSLEADIRIMSLNTTLKCSRVGEEGVALGQIAQELRVYAGEFAREASALMGEVQDVGRVTETLAAGADKDTARLVTDIMGEMRQSLDTLRMVGAALGASWAELERDTDNVVSLIEHTMRELNSQEEIVRNMRGIADTLSALSPTHAVPFDELPAPVEELLDTMARGYTMADERWVHDRVIGRSGSGEPPTKAAPADMEDILF